MLTPSVTASREMYSTRRENDVHLACIAPKTMVPNGYLNAHHQTSGCRLQYNSTDPDGSWTAGKAKVRTSGGPCDALETSSSILAESMQRHPTPACKAAHASKAAQARTTVTGLTHNNALLAVKLNTYKAPESRACAALSACRRCQELQLAGTAKVSSHTHKMPHMSSPVGEARC
jgi:hypothetical protein